MLIIFSQIPLFSQSKDVKPNETFDKVIHSVQRSSNREERYNRVMQHFSRRQCTTNQLLDACYYMPNDKIKYRLCLIAYPHIIDKNNFFDIYDVFSQLSYAIRLYHNIQAMDWDLDYGNNYEDYSSYIDDKYSSINFPSVDGYTGLRGDHCDLPMSENDFKYFFNGLSLDTNDDLQLQSVKQKLTQHCFSTAQIMKLGLELQLEKNRLAFLKFAINKCFDVENFIESLQIINHTYYKDDLKVFIKKHLVSTSPIPVPDNNIDCYTNTKEFSEIRSIIQDQNFSDQQKKAAKRYIAKRCLSVEQLKEIVSIFRFDNNKLEIIMYLYDYIPFKDDIYTFKNELRYLNSKQKLDRFILDKE